MPHIYYMKEACEHCPFRRDVKPFLTPERGAELAYLATNQYNTFACHKTTDSDDETGKTYRTNKSLECAGFMTLQNVETECGLPTDFSPSPNIYNDTYEMIDAYEEANK